MPTPIDADDVPLDLPPTDGDGDLSDEIGGPALADEDEHDGAAARDDAERESIGLDVSVGFDLDADLSDLIDDLGSDAQRWSGVVDVVNDQIVIDARDLADTDADEDGWTADNDAAGDSVAHRDDELGDGDLPALGSDAGGDGFAEDGPAPGDGDEADLPPIDAGEGDFDSPDASVLDSSLMGRFDAGIAGEREQDRCEVSPGVYWPYFPEAQRRVTELAVVGDGREVIHVGADAWLWGAEQLINLDATTSASQAPLLGGTHVVVDPADRSLAVSSGSGLWRVDAAGDRQNLGGPSADAEMIANATLAFTHEGTQGRLWAQSRLGTLFSLLSDPARWSLIDSPRPGRKLASDGRRALAYVHSAPKRPCALVQSQDGGISWFGRTIAVSDVTLVERVLVCRDVVVLVCDSMTVPVMVSVGDEDPAELLDGLRAPLTLVHEDSEVVLYGCVVTPERVFLIRQPLGRPRRAPSIIEVWSEREAGMPTAIAAAYSGGTTDLLVLRTRDGVPQVRRLRLEIERDSME